MNWPKIKKKGLERRVLIKSLKLQKYLQSKNKLKNYPKFIIDFLKIRLQNSLEERLFRILDLL